MLYTRPRRPGRPRVHPRPARRSPRTTGVTVDDVAKRLDRLRLPRPDDVVPGRRHADGRADRVRGPRRDRPVLRRDDRDPGARSTGSARGSGAPEDSPLRDAPAHRARRSSASGTAPTPASSAVFPAGRRPRQVLAAGRPASTRPTATATWSAPARRPRRSPSERRRRHRPHAGCWRLAHAQARRPAAVGRGRRASATAALVWAGGAGDVPGDDRSTRSTGSARSPRPSPPCWSCSCVDDGLLALDDPVGRSCSATSGTPTARSARCSPTLRACRPSRSAPWWERSAGRLVRRAGRRQRRRRRGRSPAHQQFHYSNLGFALLGEVVARLRGQHLVGRASRSGS